MQRCQLDRQHLEQYSGISIVNGDLETVSVNLSSDLLSNLKLFLQVRTE